MRDYVAWHDDYDEPGSGLSLRLLVVQDLIAATLDEAPPGPIRVISMCAGQGRDVITVARRHRRGRDLTGRLVELDPHNVDVARAAIAAAGLTSLKVVEADAGRSDAYLDTAPADLVLACGIFGNITDADVERTVEWLPSVCAPDATVIWTRGLRDDTIVPTIDGWFTRTGFASRAVVIGAGGIFGVGAAQWLGGHAPALQGGERIFDFVY
jgi:hypothetical protein